MKNGSEEEENNGVEKEEKRKRERVGKNRVGEEEI